MLALLFVAWTVFSIGLHSQIIIPLDATVADRWHYMPSIGLLGLVLLWLKDKVRERRSRHLGLGLMATVLLAFSVRTFIRSQDFVDEEALLRRDLVYQPESFPMMSQLGNILLRSNRQEEACNLFARSVQLGPKWWVNTNNLGYCLAQAGKLDEAKNYFKLSIQNGNYHMAVENYAKILIYEKDYKKARELINEALGLFPGNKVLPSLLASIPPK